MYADELLKLTALNNIFLSKGVERIPIAIFAILYTSLALVFIYFR
jgi:hypothetical protein